MKKKVTKLKALNCFICRKVITDKKKLSSPGARNLGIALCSFKCAQQFTIETGMC